MAHCLRCFLVVEFCPDFVHPVAMILIVLTYISDDCISNTKGFNF